MNAWLKTMSLAALLLSSSAALADPEFGRARGPLGYDQIGLLASTARGFDFTNYFPKFASADDMKIVKAMGDALLRAKPGEKLVAVAQTSWTRGVKKDPRVVARPVTFIAHIDGGGSDDGLNRPLPGLTAKVDYCRSFWFSYIVDIALTMDMVHPRLNELVTDATPYINKKMGEDYSLSVVRLAGCKLTGSSEWAFNWSGTAHGKDRWVFMGRYTPSSDTHPSVEVRSIPNHRRSDKSKAEGAAWSAPPVNQYDAALMPTPGDVSGMKDIGQAAAPLASAAPQALSADEAARLLTSAPIPIPNSREGYVLLFKPDGRVMTADPKTGEEGPPSTWRVSTQADGQLVLEYGPHKLIGEEVLNALRHVPRKN